MYLIKAVLLRKILTQTCSTLLELSWKTLNTVLLNDVTLGTSLQFLKYKLYFV